MGKNKKSKIGFISFIIGMSLAKMINVNGGFKEEWKNIFFIELPIVFVIYLFIWFVFLRRMEAKEKGS